MRTALVDLHCHVLPGLDDGAANLDDSLALARQAEADGIDTICATPHIRADHDVRIEHLPERVAALNNVLREAGIGVTVVTGGELGAERVPHLSDAELRAVTLGGGGRWLLLEPRPGPMDDALDHTVDAVHDRGFSCLIAHPERHAGADAAERLHGLVQRGALVQATAAFLAEGPAAPTMLDWAAQGLIHVVASDAHSAHIGRPAAVSAGIAALGSIPRVAPHLQWVGSGAPRELLAGRPVSPPF